MYLRVRLVWSKNVITAREKRNNNRRCFGPDDECYDFLTHLSNVARELEACYVANPNLKNTIKFNWSEMAFVFSIWEDYMPVEQQLLQKWFALRRHDRSTDGSYFFKVANETISMEEYENLAE